MEHLIEFGVFFAKVIVIVLGIIALIAFTAGQTIKGGSKTALLEVDRIRHRIDSYASQLKSEIFSKKDLKKFLKEKKKELKNNVEIERRLFVVDFEGDIQASNVKLLRDEISIVLNIADKENDEVMVRVNSPGGVVSGYGLAAAQLDRVKKSGIPLTISVDKVAASGGYMMACTGHKIIASPFAIVGSIGVLAQVPNFHRLLKDNKIDYQEYTSGDYKRTVSLFGEITEKGQKKFTEQIVDTHNLFKNFVAHHRPQVEIDKVGTGEYWLALQAMDLKLIDEIMTSDEYMLSQPKTTEVVKVKLTEKKNLGEKLGFQVAKIFEQSLEKIIQRFSHRV